MRCGIIIERVSGPYGAGTRVEGAYRVGLLSSVQAGRFPPNGLEGGQGEDGSLQVFRYRAHEVGFLIGNQMH